MDASRDIHLPVRSRLSWFYALSLLIAILMAAASLAGLGYRALVYPTDELIRSLLPNDVVNLLIALPCLLASLWLARRGRLVGLLCWVGALFVVLYNYLIYVFAMPFNFAFFMHLALATLSAYTLIGLIAIIDGRVVEQWLRGVVHERLGGGVLAALGFLFFVRVLGVLANALANGVAPAQSELAVHVSDFLITPAWIVGGLLLWQRKQLGYVTGLGLLFQASVLFIALIVFLLIQPLLTAAPLAATDVAVVSAMGLIAFIPFGLFWRGAAAKPGALSA